MWVADIMIRGTFNNDCAIAIFSLSQTIRVYRMIIVHKAKTEKLSPIQEAGRPRIDVPPRMNPSPCSLLCASRHLLSEVQVRRIQQRWRHQNKRYCAVANFKFQRSALACSSLSRCAGSIEGNKYRNTNSPARDEDGMKEGLRVLYAMRKSSIQDLD